MRGVHAPEDKEVGWRGISNAPLFQPILVSTKVCVGADESCRRALQPQTSLPASLLAVASLLASGPSNPHPRGRNGQSSWFGGLETKALPTRAMMTTVLVAVRPLRRRKKRCSLHGDLARAKDGSLRTRQVRMGELRLEHQEVEKRGGGEEEHRVVLIAITFLRRRRQSWSGSRMDTCSTKVYSARLRRSKRYDMIKCREPCWYMRSACTVVLLVRNNGCCAAKGTYRHVARAAIGDHRQHTRGPINVLRHHGAKAQSSNSSGWRYIVVLHKHQINGATYTRALQQ